MCKRFIITYTCGHKGVTVHPHAGFEANTDGATCNKIEYYYIQKDEECGMQRCDLQRLSAEGIA
jgi:hypothetical protein